MANLYLKLVLTTCVLAFCAVVFSAYARLSDAGLGCENWPACYEQNALKQRQPHKVGVARDHAGWQWKLQNLVGLLLSILSIAICSYSWQKRRELRQSPLLPTLLLGLMAFLAGFGIFAFAYLPRPVIVLIHLAGGIAMLMLLIWMGLRLIEPRRQQAVVDALRWQRYSQFGLGLVLLEILLGGWVSSNFAALACTDFPLCQGTLLPNMDFSISLKNDGMLLSGERLTAMHWMHRIGALLTLAYLTWLSLMVMAVRQLRKNAQFIIGIAWLQFMLGISNVFFSMPLMSVVLHNAVAMLLLSLLTLLNFRLRRSVAVTSLNQPV